MFNKFVLLILNILPKKLIWVFSKKYIAGETIDDAISLSKKLNADGQKVTIDLLGESVENLDDATSYKEQYLDIIENVEKENVDGNYSLKPTMFGLNIDAEFAYNSIREIVEKASKYKNFVRIDMEDVSCTDKEIYLYERLLKEFPKNVGLVFQAYLKRTITDLKELNQLRTKGYKLNYRLCKGIYNEDSKVAYKDFFEINSHYLEDLKYLFENNTYVGIATHDDKLVEGACKLIDIYSLDKDKYEFQMLLGVCPELRKKIVKEGHTVRVYVPFGKDWLIYSKRRFKENPKMIKHIIKAIFIKG